MKPYLFILLVLYFIFSFYGAKYDILNIPARSVIIIIIFALIVPYTIRIQKHRIILYFSVLFLILLFYTIGITYFINGNFDILNAFRFIIQTYLILIVLIYFLNIKYYRYKVINTFIILATISSIVAILQFSGISFFYDLRNFIGGVPTDPIVLHVNSLRPPGLSLFALHLAYHNLVAILLSVFMYNHTKSRVYLIVVIILLFGIIASGTRSPLIGLFVVSMWYFIRNFKIRASMIYVVLLAIVILFILSLTNLRITNFTNDSATDKIILGLYGLSLFIDNPFGYGLSFNSTEYVDNFFNIFNDDLGVAVAEKFALHNGFLNIMTKYGFVGLFIFILITYKVYKIPITSDKYLQLYFFAYLINCLVHNAIFLHGDFFIIILIALIINLHFDKKRMIKVNSIGEKSV